MAKYDPLNRYLRRHKTNEVVLTFSKIENLLTALLPKSARAGNGGSTRRPRPRPYAGPGLGWGRATLPTRLSTRSGSRFGVGAVRTCGRRRVR